MDIRFQSANKVTVRSECLIYPTFEDPSPAAVQNRFTGTVAEWLCSSEALADYKGRKGDITVCYGPSASPVPRIILVGMGAREKADTAVFRNAMAAAVRRCKDLRLARICFVLEDVAAIGEAMGNSREELLRESLTAASLAVYSCTEYRSVDARVKGKKENDPKFCAPESLTIFHRAKNIPPQLRVPVRLAEAEAAGVCLARDLVNAPANIMTPARMAEEALALAKRHGFGCRVLSKTELLKVGMGALLAVSEGSRKDPRFVILEFTPAGGRKRAPLILVGKGITFDTGGISLKPSAGMADMKGDMAGAAAVLGAFEALGRFSEGVGHPVIGLLPLTENMPDGTAARPGDVVTTLSGKTVEILNTDAEGRLILCDTLSYAQKNWSALAIVDIATLTGACAVALGRGAAGLFTDSEALRGAILEAGAETGDTFWPMPLWDKMAEGLKSTVADLANIGPREGGAITAAVFLKSFMDASVPWAHLDMAGAGLTDDDKPLCPKGGTGFGVRTLFTLIRRASDKMLK